MFHLQAAVFPLVPPACGPSGRRFSDLGCSYSEINPLAGNLHGTWQEGFFFFATSAGHLAPPHPDFYLAPPRPCVREAGCVPGAARPAAGWRTSRGRLTAGSPPHPPSLSPVINCVSPLPLRLFWTPKFQRPSVKANRRYLKGHQEAGQRHR